MRPWNEKLLDVDELLEVSQSGPMSTSMTAAEAVKFNTSKTKSILNRRSSLQ